MSRGNIREGYSKGELILLNGESYKVLEIKENFYNNKMIEIQNTKTRQVITLTDDRNVRRTCTEEGYKQCQL